MHNLFYVFKIIAVTIVVVILMQVEVGHQTVEHRAEHFIRQSSIMEPARLIAQGGFVFFKDAYHKGMKTVDSFVSKEFRSEGSPGRRKLMEIKRSLSFEKLKEKKAQASDSEESED